MNGLLDDNVVIDREALEEAVEKAAMSCARGVRQVQAIVEIIETGQLSYDFVPMTGYIPKWSPGIRAQFGKEADLNRSSWNGLKLRLQAAGFTVRLVSDKDAEGKRSNRRFEVRWSTEPTQSNKEKA